MIARRSARAVWSRRREILIALSVLAQLAIVVAVASSILEGSFPHDLEPDGAVQAPHHFTYGVIAAALLAFVVWDDHPKREPIVVVGSLAAGYFAFLHVWKWYPVTGAALVLLALAGAWFGLLRPQWDDWNGRVRLAVAICVLVAYDDALEHALGIPTPLDFIWNVHLGQYIV